MIVFCSEGRLGNQLFQYAFLRSLASNQERIIFFRGGALIETFVVNDSNCIFIKSRIANAVMSRLAHHGLLQWFCCLRLISCVSQGRRRTETGYIVAESSYSGRRGLIGRIRYVDTGYFQSERFFTHEVASRISQREMSLQAANQFLRNARKEHDHLVFVHVRRGDYLKEAPFGNPDMSLPLGYYLACIDWFQNNYEKPLFVFLTDDASFVKEKFSHLRDTVVSECKMDIDFAIMTLCDSGVLSNSSFSWWGAFMMQARHIVFYPKYWLGFRKQIEHPEGIYPSFGICVDPSNPQISISSNTISR